MPGSAVAEIICRQCRRAIAAETATCPHCGASAHVHNDDSNAAGLGRRRVPWYDNQIVVLCLMWAAMGPFALPILWYSRAFSPLNKLIQTVLMACLTAFIAWGLWFAWNVTLPMLLDLWRG